MTCDICGKSFDFTQTRVLEPGRCELLNGFGGIVGRMDSTKKTAVVYCVMCPAPARGNWSTEVGLRLDSGDEVVLSVECQVSGRFRPAKISGDPDSCYEAETPEVEPLRATMAEAPGVAVDLATLSKTEDARLMDALMSSLQCDTGGEP